MDKINLHTPIFANMILFKVVKELNIKHRMAEGIADHAVACYAEGSNSDGYYILVLIGINLFKT